MKRITSVRRKMMLVVMATTLVALLLSAAALLVYELRTYRAGWLVDLTTQADLVAQASMPALAFDNARVARENLALLRLRPHIEAAGLYDAEDNLFAAYVGPGQRAPSQRLVRRPKGAVFDGEQLDLQQPILQDGERVGTMMMRARYDVAPRFQDYLLILGLVTLASLLLASLVARRLQHTVTDPIVAVADVARDVVQQRNYALRAPKTTHDEVGDLVDAFNDMLLELGGQAEALKAADRRKDEFLATLAHELRNPLAPLSTALAILARDDTDADIRRRIREMMQRQLQQLVRLIDDLLEVSRISTGRLALQVETLDLVVVLNSALESVAPLLQERHHELVVHTPPAPVWIDGDRTRLAQVFVNLLNNAAKYTDPGGRIGIGLALEDGQVEVSIADNGIGIAPAMQAEVFEMFVQVDQSLERGRAGLGLGLALARQLVLLHGGQLTLRSAGLGQGSTFAVRLALAAAAPTQPAAPPAAAPAAGAPGERIALRILLADDNRDFADSLAQVLTSLGHEVQVVYDGQSAMAAAVARPPDVGLFDIGMPGMNGYELATALRRQQALHKQKQAMVLAAITGWGQESDRQRAHEAGFDHHLVKPVDVEKLVALIARRRPADLGAD